METEDFDGLVKIHAKECSPDKVGFHFSIQNTFPQKKQKKYMHYYRTVPSAMWPMFSEFSYSADLFHEP